MRMRVRRFRGENCLKSTSSGHFILYELARFWHNRLSATCALRREEP